MVSLSSAIESPPLAQILVIVFSDEKGKTIRGGKKKKKSVNENEKKKKKGREDVVGLCS